jgi:hypothetical protein
MGPADCHPRINHMVFVSLPLTVGRAGRWIWNNVAPGLGISVVLVFVVALVGEIYFRASTPSFVTSTPSFVTEWPVVFDPQIGSRFRPNAEVATTNNRDYWTRQRANSIGFLDREPVSPEARPGTCHLVFIGDSFVEAHHVEIEQKVQVVLERMSAERLPEFKLTTAAFGISDTGQLNQLPIYDLFAHRQHPKVVVLVFTIGDFSDNSAVIQAIKGYDPAHMPKLFARRNAAGDMELQPIDPHWSNFGLLRFEQNPGRLRAWLLQHSKLYRWIEDKNAWRVRSDQLLRYARVIAERPEYASLMRDWDLAKTPSIDEVYNDESLAPIFREALDFTGFALDQFQERAHRDSFNLLILATEYMKQGTGLAFDRLERLAKARNIPVIDLYGFIRAHGGRSKDAHFRHDGHWSPQGHRWAAEAVLDYLAAHPALCH